MTNLTKGREDVERRMTRLGWVIFLGILGAVIVTMAAGMATEQDWVILPYQPGVRYLVVEVWDLNDGSLVVFHRLNKNPNAIRSFRSIDHLEVVETKKQSWVEIGEKDPTKLVLNPRDLKNKSVKDFERFLSAKRNVWNIRGFSGLGAILLAIIVWPAKKED